MVNHSPFPTITAIYLGSVINRYSDGCFTNQVSTQSLEMTIYLLYRLELLAIGPQAFVKICIALIERCFKVRIAAVIIAWVMRVEAGIKIMMRYYFFKWFYVPAFNSKTSRQCLYSIIHSSFPNLAWWSDFLEHTLWWWSKSEVFRLQCWGYG